MLKKFILNRYTNTIQSIFKNSFYFLNNIFYKNKKVGFFLKSAISIIVIFYFFKQLNYIDLKKILYKLEYYDVAVLFVINLVMLLIWSLRYYILLRQKIAVNILEVIKQILIVSFSNNFLPSAIGGDGVRVYLASRIGLTLKESGLIVILERLMGLSAFLIIGLISSFFWDIPEKLHGIIILLNSIFFILIFFLYKNIKNISTYFGLNGKNDKIKYDIYFNKVVLLKTFILSLFYQFLSIYISYYTAISIEIDNISIFPFLSLIPIVWIITLLPITLGGIGLREFSLLYLFSVLNFSHEDILTISLGTYLTFFFSSIMGLLIIIYEKARLKKK